MMRTAALLALLLVIVGGVPALSAAAIEAPPPGPIQSIDAQDHGDEPAEGAANENGGWDAVVIWSLVGLGIFAAALGVLYFMKRQVGGFPENPSWVAPITIMQSKDFPDESDFGEAPAGAQSHGAGH